MFFGISWLGGVGFRVRGFLAAALAGGGGAGAEACRRCAPVPLSEPVVGRTLNSFGGLSPVHGRPFFAKHSIHVDQLVEIAPVHSDLIAARAAVPDGFCWLVPQSDKRTKQCLGDIGLDQPRSDLSCHHVMLA